MSAPQKSQPTPEDDEEVVEQLTPTGRKFLRLTIAGAVLAPPIATLFGWYFDIGKPVKWYVGVLIGFLGVMYIWATIMAGTRKNAGRYGLPYISQEGADERELRNQGRAYAYSYHMVLSAGMVFMSLEFLYPKLTLMPFLLIIGSVCMFGRRIYLDRKS